MRMHNKQKLCPVCCEPTFKGAPGRGAQALPRLRAHPASAGLPSCCPLGNPRPPGPWSWPHSGPVPSHSEPEKGAGLSHPPQPPPGSPLLQTRGLPAPPGCPSPDSTLSSPCSSCPLPASSGPRWPEKQKDCRDRALGHPLRAGACLGDAQLLGHSVQDLGGGSALSTRRLGCSPEVTLGMAPTPVLSLRPCTDSHVFSSSPPACWGGNPMTQAMATWDQV